MQTKLPPVAIPLLLLLLAALVLLSRPERPVPSLQDRIEQRLIEAELGSATSFHLAAGPRAAQPPSAEPLSEVLAELNASQPERRWAAAGELSARRDPRAVDAVIRALRDPRDTVRVCLMASTLGYLRDPRALGPLTEAAFDPGNRDLRLCAIESLGMLGDRRAVPHLIRALQARNMPVASADALARLGDPRAVEPLIEAAHDPELALWMIRALGELGNAMALPYLEERDSVTQTTAALRPAVAEARWKIGRLNSSDRVRALAEALRNDTDRAHRAWAAFRLGELRHAEAVPALLSALSDNNKEVSERAAAALIRIGDPARLPVRTLAMATGAGQEYALAVLGYLGEAADIPRLQALAAGKNAALSTVAARSVVLIQAFHAAKQDIVNLR